MEEETETRKEVEERIKRDHGKLTSILVNHFPLLFGAATSSVCRAGGENYGMLVGPALWTTYNLAHKESLKKDLPMIFESFLGGLLPYVDKMYVAGQEILNYFN